MSTFKPMLAATLQPEEVHQIPYPVLGSPKLDGIRTILAGSVRQPAVTRSLKPIPNEFIQRTLIEALSEERFWGLDGEIIVGDPTAPDVYNKTQSAVMSRHGEPDFTFWAFDRIPLESHRSRTFHERFNSILVPSEGRFDIVPHTLLENAEDLLRFEAECTLAGYEGIMLRKLDGQYKYGRSTLTQGWLMKLKRFEDAEAMVIGYEELFSNQNEATTNALGHTERSSHKANLVPQGVLGALRAVTPQGVEFSVGSGFDAATRALLWAQRDSLVGRTVKYKFFPVGVKEAPRFPTFLGFRSEEDL